MAGAQGNAAMVNGSKAAVLTNKETIEMQEFPLPEIGETDGLLLMESCGMCGTDYEVYYGHMAPKLPLILGHEPIGIVAKIGAVASEEWGVKIGDRVALGATHGIGLTTTEKAPSLWGGYAQYMYMQPGSRVFPISKDIPPEAAATYNALATGFEWGVLAAGLKKGQSIVIMGPGQRGLASLLAAKASGAAFVAITGLNKDTYKLELAKELGADLVINVDHDDPVETILRKFEDGVDVVLDTTPYATEPLVQGVKMIRGAREGGGNVVVAGIKGGKEVTGFSTDDLVRKRGSIRTGGSPSNDAVRSAIRLLESGNYPWERLVTHTFPLQSAQEAIRTLSGELPDRKAINVVLLPNQ